jgi:hypothetical protein
VARGQRLAQYGAGGPRWRYRTGPCFASLALQQLAVCSFCSPPCFSRTPLRSLPPSLPALPRFQQANPLYSTLPSSCCSSTIPIPYTTSTTRPDPPTYLPIPFQSHHPPVLPPPHSHLPPASSFSPSLVPSSTSPLASPHLDNLLFCLLAMHSRLFLLA